MASGIVGGNSHPQRYRRRRPLPALILILILGIAATVVWLRVMNNDDDNATATHCDPPPTKPTTGAKPTAPPTTLGQSLNYDALDRTVPTPPGQVLVRVLNASSTKGAARIVTEGLRQIGFDQVAEPDNDPLYGNTMSCRAEIRFGPQGTSAARTLSLVDPCAELIRDDRRDATVDMAIGENFDTLHPNSQARTLLEQLAVWAQTHPETKGGLQADSPKPNLDKSMLTGARQVHC